MIRFWMLIQELDSRIRIWNFPEKTQPVSFRILMECWFLRRGENHSTRRKTSRSKERTNNKLNPHMTLGPRIEPGPHWWDASALTITPPLLPCIYLRKGEFSLLDAQKVISYVPTKCSLVMSVRLSRTQSRNVIDEKWYSIFLPCNRAT